MKEIYLAVLLMICNVLLVASLEEQCFEYTWPGAGVSVDDINCTEYHIKHPYIPCIEPILTGDQKPDTSDVWNKKNDPNEENHFCPLKDGNVCVRYTYIYNSAVMNVSYFCGKVIEDKTTPVTEGCYVQYAEGYTIEACACKSVKGKMPCNSTIRSTYSTLITVIATAVPLLIYKILNIP